MSRSGHTSLAEAWGQIASTRMWFVAVMVPFSLIAFLKRLGDSNAAYAATLSSIAANARDSIAMNAWLSTSVVAAVIATIASWKLRRGPFAVRASLLLCSLILLAASLATEMYIAHRIQIPEIDRVVERMENGESFGQGSNDYETIRRERERATAALREAEAILQEARELKASLDADASKKSP